VFLEGRINLGLDSSVPHPVVGEKC
jgi:hypothetical protein